MFIYYEVKHLFIVKPNFEKYTKVDQDFRKNGWFDSSNGREMEETSESHWIVRIKASYQQEIKTVPYFEEHNWNIIEYFGLRCKKQGQLETIKQELELLWILSKIFWIKFIFIVNIYFYFESIEDKILVSKSIYIILINWKRLILWIFFGILL